MRLIFTCGGTAGHIYPAVGIANLVKERHPNASILFVGAEEDMETLLVPREGFTIQTVKVHRLRHSVSPAAIKYNIKSVSMLRKARADAHAILTEFKPDMVVGTGGYASYPLTIEATKQGIATAIHESNAMPGWTTRMLAAKVDDMLVSFEDSKRYYAKAKNVQLVGTPVRGAFIGQKKDQCRLAMGITDDKPIVLSFWGSLGAKVMNTLLLDCIKQELAHGAPFHHIHACGKSGFGWMPDALGVSLPPNIELREFVYDMPVVMNAADLVLCRAGASTLAEICATGTPSILVPSPNVTNNHQDANAQVLERAGAAIRLPESICTGNLLYSEITRLLGDSKLALQMEQAARSLSFLDASERIYQIIMGHMKNNRRVDV